MTDVLERRATAADIADDIHDVAAPPSFDLALSMRIFLAATSAAAGAIHLAMVPSHWSESAVDGVGFAAAGWLQLVFAAIVFARPSTLVLKAGILVNAAAIGAWISSRTAGFPWGSHAGHAASAGVVDVTCVVLEGLVIASALVALLRPRIGARHVRGGLITAVAASIGVFAVTTSVLASPSARDHAAGTHGDHSSEGAAAAADGHGHATSVPADDKGFGLLSNGQHDHVMVEHELDAPTQKELDRQLAITREVAARTPTVADAEKAGYTHVGPYFPGIGAHYWKPLIGPGAPGGFSGDALNPDGVIDDEDLNNPLMLIFDGREPTSRIAGFMYYSMAGSEPAGFVGRNDTWHYHENLCLKTTPAGIDVPFGLDNSATQAECDSVGGWMLEASQYMVHVWSVSGYEMSPEYGGVFGEANPKLDCADGTYYQLPKDEWVNNSVNVCIAQ